MILLLALLLGIQIHRLSSQRKGDNEANSGYTLDDDNSVIAQTLLDNDNSLNATMLSNDDKRISLYKRIIVVLISTLAVLQRQTNIIWLAFVTFWSVYQQGLNATNPDGHDHPITTAIPIDSLTAQHSLNDPIDDDLTFSSQGISIHQGIATITQSESSFNSHRINCKSINTISSMLKISKSWYNHLKVLILHQLKTIGAIIRILLNQIRIIFTATGHWEVIVFVACLLLGYGLSGRAVVLGDAHSHRACLNLGQLLLYLFLRKCLLPFAEDEMLIKLCHSMTSGQCIFDDNDCSLMPKRDAKLSQVITAIHSLLTSLVPSNAWSVFVVHLMRNKFFSLHPYNISDKNHIVHHLAMAIKYSDTLAMVLAAALEQQMRILWIALMTLYQSTAIPIK